MDGVAKTIIVLGVALIVLGITILGFQKYPFGGKLPGDILIKRENYSIYLPLTTCIIVSIVISFIVYLIGKFK